MAKFPRWSYILWVLSRGFNTTRWARWLLTGAIIVGRDLGFAVHFVRVAFHPIIGHERHLGKLVIEKQEANGWQIILWQKLTSVLWLWVVGSSWHLNYLDLLIQLNVTLGLHPAPGKGKTFSRSIFQTIKPPQIRSRAPIKCWYVCPLRQFSLTSCDQPTLQKWTTAAMVSHKRISCSPNIFARSSLATLAATVE